MNNYEQATQEVRDAFNALCEGRVEAAVKAEREACAKVCEDNATDLSEGDWDSACINCADYIRARGEASLRSTT